MARAEIVSGELRIAAGPYEIFFIEGPGGKPIKVGFTLESGSLESSYIPDCFFGPAVRQAAAIFHARRERAKREARHAAENVLL